MSQEAKKKFDSALAGAGRRAPSPSAAVTVGGDPTVEEMQRRIAESRAREGERAAAIGDVDSTRQRVANARAAGGDVVIG